MLMTLPNRGMRINASVGLLDPIGLSGFIIGT